jgi:hypothetical protein
MLITPLEHGSSYGRYKENGRKPPESVEEPGNRGQWILSGK